MDLTIIDWNSLLAKFMVALMIGVLIGVERQFSQRDAAEEASVAGIRTFPLISLGGFVAAAASEFVIWAFPAAFLFLGALAATAYHVRATRYNQTGTTTQIAALVVFLLGGLCFWGELGIASSTVVIMALFLSYKGELHQLVTRLEVEDVHGIILLSLITVVILPVLPNQDPRTTWLMVVFIAAISFSGYGLSKIVGDRVGAVSTGLLGGLVSSTAVTLTFTRRCKTMPERAGSYATAMALATTTLYPRILLILLVWSPAMLPDLVVPFSIFFVAGMVGSIVLWRSTENRDMKRMEMRNPLEMRFALKFGLLFALILALVRGAYEVLGSEGVLVTGFFAGLEGLDAITLSVGRLVPDTVAAATASQALLLAVVANTLVKGLVVTFGPSVELRRKMLSFFGVQIVLALIALFLT
ncbi:MgtC/SapB family protein [Gemmatimonadota bacterium]